MNEAWRLNVLRAAKDSSRDDNLESDTPRDILTLRDIIVRKLPDNFEPRIESYIML